MVGEFPGLTTGLDEDGNLRATSDFRGLYAALAEQWLGGVCRRHRAECALLHPSQSRAMTRAVLVALLLLAMVAGPAIVELYNLGEDDHDLALRRAAPGGAHPPHRLDASGRRKPARSRARTRPVRPLVHDRRPSRARHADALDGTAGASCTFPHSTAEALTCPRTGA
jgi:hypothetical protein